MSLPTHPLLSLVERNSNCLKSMLTHYIDTTVDKQFASLKDSILLMIQSGQIDIGPQNYDVAILGTTLPPPTQANTDQSSAQCSHEYSNDTLTRAPKHQNNLQNEVALANTITTESMIKQEFNDDENEDGKKIDDDNVAKCEKGEKRIYTSGDMKRENEYESCGTTQHNVHAALKNNQTPQQIISNDILTSPSPTNPINTEQLIKQEYLQDSPITIPLDFNRNASLNDISIKPDELVEGQNPHNQTDQFDDNHNVDNDGPYEGDENDFLNNSNCIDCANGDFDLHENNNNHSNDDVSAGDGDETDIETKFDEAQLQIDIRVTNNTQLNNQNVEENVINERSVIEQNNEQSTSTTTGLRPSTCKRNQTKVFGDLVQSKRKNDQLNESLNKVIRRSLNDDENTDSDDNEGQDEVNSQINNLESIFDTRATIEHYNHDQHNSDESMVIQQKERDANNAIGDESIATECTTNPIQPNRHWQCSHCHKSFDRLSNLQRHLRVHTGERPFQCHQCDKRFSVKGNLTTHQLIHRNIKSFRCHECEKQFTQQNNLDSHLLVHSGVRPFECRHCAKSFKTLGHRNSHEQAIHLHVKPNRCKQCGHTATKRSSIITHIRTVHFGLPQTIKEQRALNIIDERDPRELIEKV